MKERVEIIRDLYAEKSNIQVVSFSGASVDVTLLNGCKAIIRGIRSLRDYDYELQLQQINKEISLNKVNTICLFADKEFSFVSSSMVKEIFNLGKSISEYVDSKVEEKMLTKRKNY